VGNTPAKRFFKNAKGHTSKAYFADTPIAPFTGQLWGSNGVKKALFVSA
jgi:hypothetical protein